MTSAWLLTFGAFYLFGWQAVASLVVAAGIVHAAYRLVRGHWMPLD